MARGYWHPTIKVYLSCTQEWVPEKTVKALNIEEDIQGRDRLTFECPKCRKQHDSLRVG